MLYRALSGPDDYNAIPLLFGLIVCKQEAVFEESHRGQRANKDIQTMYDFIKTQTVNKDADYSVSVLHLLWTCNCYGSSIVEAEVREGRAEELTLSWRIAGYFGSRKG
jgi:hypothetical protein